MREAGRVAKPGAPVIIQVWGPHERNDLEAVKAIVRPFLPPRPPDAPPEPDYSEPGVLEYLAERAGLTPERALPGSSAPSGRSGSRTRSWTAPRPTADAMAATGSRTTSTP